MATVGVVGLGARGSRIARRLAADNQLVVWNRDPARAEPLVAAGAVAAGRPADVASQAEAVITIAPDPRALPDLTEGSEGVAAGVGVGSTVLQTLTVGPALVVRFVILLALDAGL